MHKFVPCACNQYVPAGTLFQTEGPKNGADSPSPNEFVVAIKIKANAPKYANFLSIFRNLNPKWKMGLLLIWHFLSYPDCGMILEKLSVWTQCYQRLAFRVMRL